MEALHVLPTYIEHLPDVCVGIVHLNDDVRCSSEAKFVSGRNTAVVHDFQLCKSFLPDVNTIIKEFTLQRKDNWIFYGNSRTTSKHIDPLSVVTKCRNADFVRRNHLATLETLIRNAYIVSDTDGEKLYTLRRYGDASSPKSSSLLNNAFDSDSTTHLLGNSHTNVAKGYISHRPCSTGGNIVIGTTWCAYDR